VLNRRRLVVLVVDVERGGSRTRASRRLREFVRKFCESRVYFLTSANSLSLLKHKHTHTYTHSFYLSLFFTVSPSLRRTQLPLPEPRVPCATKCNIRLAILATFIIIIIIINIEHIIIRAMVSALIRTPLNRVSRTTTITEAELPKSTIY